MQWSEVITDPSLRDLPYKIELNKWGVIEMTPASNWHALAQEVWLVSREGFEYYGLEGRREHSGFGIEPKL